MKPAKDDQTAKNPSAIDRGNFKFVVDLEWDKYTGYFDRELEYADVLIDHKYYMETVFKGAMAASNEPLTARSVIDYGAGIRTMIINEEGAFVDKAQYEADLEENMDPKEKEELAMLKAAQGIGREVMHIEQQTEKMATNAKKGVLKIQENTDILKVSQRKTNFGAFLDGKTRGMTSFFKLVGSGGISAFITALIVFFVFQLATIIAYWTVQDYYIIETKINAYSLRDISKYQMFLSNIADSVIYIGMVNTGLNFPHKTTSQSEKLASLAHELQYTISQLDQLNRNQGDTIYALKDASLVSRWVEFKSVQMVGYGNEPTEKLSLNNALRAWIGRALQFKDRAASSIKLTDVDGIYLVRNGLGGIMSDLDAMKREMHSSFVSKDLQFKKFAMVLPVVQLVIAIALVVAVTVVVIWIYRKRSSYLKVYYMFNGEDLAYMRSETERYFSLVKTRDPSSILSVNSVSKELFEATEEKQHHRVTADHITKRFWNKKSMVKLRLTGVDLWFMISLIVFSVVTGCLMIAKGMMDNQKFGAVIENSQSIYSYSQLKYLAITAFTTGLAKELSVNFELGGKVLSDPRTVLKNFKVEQSVNCLHLEYLWSVCVF